MRLLLIVFGWSAGLVFAASLSNSHPLLWLLTGIVFTSLIFVRPITRLRPALLIAAAFAWGAFRLALVPTNSTLAAFNNSGGLTVEGVVVAAPDIRDTGARLRVEVDAVTQAGTTQAANGLVLVETMSTRATYGDRVRATGLLVTPGEYDTFSYADYLARSGVFSVMKQAVVEIDSTGHGNPLFSALAYLQQQAKNAIAAALPEPQAGLLTGILLGDERGIAPDVRDAFTATGAAHVIAISGFNMAVVGETIRRLLRAAHVEGWKAALLAIGFIVIYTLFVGANAAVSRAALMSILLIVAEQLRRKTYVPASLAFAALLITMLNPLSLWDIGFQLSFAATMGLALFANPISNALALVLRRMMPASAVGIAAPMLGVTLAAQVTVTPLIALYFGRLSLVVLFVNLLVVPVQSVLLITGGIATLTVFLAPAVGQAFYWLCLVPLSWTIEVVRAFARLPFAEVEMSIHPMLVTIFFAALVSGGVLRATQPDWALRLAGIIRNRMVATVTVFASISLIALTAAIALSRPDGKLHVWMLDVGHSNAVLVQTPGGAHILVDGGRFPSRLLTAIGDRLPFNDREIEVLVITQPDPFDTSAIAAVAARYDVGVTLTNGQETFDEGILSLLDTLSKGDVLAVSAGYSLDMNDGTRLEVLHPQMKPEAGRSLDENTLVLRLSYGEVSFLLTGDVSAAGQAALLENGQWPLASVLQLPQHGAARSLDEDFLAAVQPQVALLQADPANRNGDPSADTLEILGDIPLFRTDESGTLHLWTDGKRLTVQAERSAHD